MVRTKHIVKDGKAHLKVVMEDPEAVQQTPEALAASPQPLVWKRVIGKQIFVPGRWWNGVPKEQRDTLYMCTIERVRLFSVAKPSLVP